jgi:hypothetical protein
VVYAAGGQAYYSNTVSANAADNSGNGGGGSRGQNSITNGWVGGSGRVIIKLNYS